MALLIACVPAVARADKPPVPRLPVAAEWSVDLDAGVSSAPLVDGGRIYLTLRTGHIAARSLKDGAELWRVEKVVTATSAAADGRLYVAGGDAVEALRGEDGARLWIAPRLTATAPLVAAGGLVLIATDNEIVAVHGNDGQVAWRQKGGSVTQPPAVDGDRVFVGADDGRIVALASDSGAILWEYYVTGGVTTLAAYRGRVYAGGGDKRVYSLDAGRGTFRWSFFVGSLPTGSMAVDDEHVYFAAYDNVVRAYDRENGNQRWQAPLNQRPAGGVYAAGHVVFVQTTGKEVIMLLDRNGRKAGVITLPGETARDVAPSVRDREGGIGLLIVTGGLAGQWHLTSIGPAGEAPLQPFDRLVPLPGAVFLTDPLNVPIGVSLPWLMLGDPVLVPFSMLEYPVVLRDPPLQPLTVLPGLQLRPLSPALPVRRGG